MMEEALSARAEDDRKGSHKWEVEPAGRCLCLIAEEIFESSVDVCLQRYVAGAHWPVAAVNGSRGELYFGSDRNRSDQRLHFFIP